MARDIFHKTPPSLHVSHVMIRGSVTVYDYLLSKNLLEEAGFMKIKIFCLETRLVGGRLRRMSAEIVG